MQELDLALFKETLKIINPEMYDVMEYEKGNKFDEWITNLYKSLPKDKQHNVTLRRSHNIVMIGS